MVTLTRPVTSPFVQGEKQTFWKAFPAPAGPHPQTGEHTRPVNPSSSWMGLATGRHVEGVAKQREDGDEAFFSAAAAAGQVEDE